MGAKPRVSCEPRVASGKRPLPTSARAGRAAKVLTKVLSNLQVEVSRWSHPQGTCRRSLISCGRTPFQDSRREGVEVSSSPPSRTAGRLQDGQGTVCTFHRGSPRETRTSLPGASSRTGLASRATPRASRGPGGLVWAWKDPRGPALGQAPAGVWVCPRRPVAAVLGVVGHEVLATGYGLR